MKFDDIHMIQVDGRGVMHSKSLATEKLDTFVEITPKNQLSKFELSLIQPHDMVMEKWY